MTLLKKILGFNDQIFQIPYLKLFFRIARKLWIVTPFALSIFLDMMKTRNSSRFLRFSNSKLDSKVCQVFAIDDDSINTIKQLSFVCQGLKLSGWKIQVIFRDRSAFIGKFYFQCFGINNFIYLEDMSLDKNEVNACRTFAASCEHNAFDINSAKELKYHGVWLGGHLLSTISRVTFKGHMNFEDIEVKNLFSRLISKHLLHIVQAKKLLEVNKANLAITNEANYSIFGPLVDLSIQNGVDVLQVVQPWRDDALTCRRLNKHTRREHPGTVSKIILQEYVKKSWTKSNEAILNQIFNDRYNGKWFLQSRNQKMSLNIGSFAEIEKLGLDKQKRTAVIFSHVLWDANMFYGEDLFSDAGEWFIETIKVACENKNLNWVVKIHPANLWKLQYERRKNVFAEVDLINKFIGKLPEHVHLLLPDSPVSSLDLMRFADYGLTIRGTSGLEMACFDKVVLTAGTGRYSGLGFTLDSEDKIDYLNKIRCLHQYNASKEMTQVAKWHALLALHKRLWIFESASADFRFSKKGKTPLDHNLELNIKSLDELKKSPDLRRWAAWAEGDEIDYLSDI